MQLTQDQQRVIDLWDKNLILIASAGSGKTSVLVEKYLTILEKSDSKIENILTMTFTEKAAAELKSRIQKRLGLGPHDLDKAPILTLHGFCAELLKNQTGENLKIIDQHFATAIKARVIHDALLEFVQDNQKDSVNLINEYGFRNLKDMLFNTLDQSYGIRNWEDNKKKPPFEDPQTPSLLKLFTMLREKYRIEKDKAKLFDFDDLEEKAIHLLENNDEVRQRCQEQYTYIMIDEFQDTNPIQVRLIELLRNPQKTKFFAVGDPKQSIYQFRGADVSLFHQMVDTIKKENGELLFLRDNFRSASSLIEPINAFFEPHLSGDDFQPMIAQKEADEKDIGIQNIEIPPVAFAGERREKEADAIAQMIKQLRNEGREFRDMVCLFRTRTAISTYEAVFREYQIPCHAVSRGALFEAQEVLDVINILRVIDDPKDTISKVGVLRSPAFGISDEDLYLAFSEDRYELIEASVHAIEMMRKESHGKNINWILKFLYEQDLFDRLYRTPQELSNIEHLFGIAESFESLGVKSLKEFLQTVQALRDAGTRISEASLFAPSANCVRLMTIHASKGLEFPIVFLGDLKYLGVGASRLFLFDTKKGIGLKYLNTEKSEGLKDHYEKSPLFEQIEDEKKKNGKQESLRLLYVAMTRAKEGLYLPLTPLDPKKKSNTWNDLLAEYFIETK